MMQRNSAAATTRFLLGLLAISVLPQSTLGQRTRGLYRDVTEIPAGAIGERVRGLLEAINSNDANKMRSNVEEHFSESFQNYTPVEQHIETFQEVYKSSRGLEFYGIRRFENRRPESEVFVIVRNKLTKSWQALILNIQLEPPNKIEGLKFAPARPPRDVSTSNQGDPSRLIAELEKFMKRLADADSFSGSVLLAKDGKVLFNRAYGLASKRFGVPNKTDTKFNLGSMNKMFTGVAIAQLVQRGKLSLEDPLSKCASTDWLARDAADKIKIKHLLTHTSGLGSYFNRTYMESSKAMFRELEDYKPLILGSELAFEPGTQWQYSNTGMFMLGVVIEKVTGRDYFDYIRENIYRPAGMINSDCYDMDRPIPNLAMGYSREKSDDGGPPWSNNLYKHVIRGGPAGGGFSTVEDLLRFDIALRSHKLLNPKYTEMVWSAKPEWNSPDYGFGFGVRGVASDRIVGHGGGFDGISSNLDMFLDSGYTAIVMSNYDGASQAVSNKMRGLISLMR